MGTRHEYEQVPPQPNSKAPLWSVLPPREIVKEGGLPWSVRESLYFWPSAPRS